MNDAERFERNSFASTYEWIQSMVFAWIICILVFTFIGRQISVDGHSMEPTLQDADHIIISDLFFTPTHGDVVVLKADAFDDPIVKRVIGVAGDTIDIDFESGTVLVNGKTQAEDGYINERIHNYPPESFRISFPVTLEDGELFVMGDNRNQSTDSRSTMVGIVRADDVLGKVYAIIWPLKDFKLIK
ncbi:MAG: signal peptidase I [Oscillospiraceae bacterium]|jgi:signal peptidase I|nr:signal peptidase I [Oscillospiraceae bacterium]